MRTILVTGGAGFIGSNLCEELLKESFNVVCFDNFSTGSFENIKDFIDNPNFKLVVGDIRDIDACRRITEGVDLVFHEAALGSVPRSIADPKTSNDVNISGFLNILIASNENKVKRVIYAASSSTYGDSKSLPKIEDKIGKPLSPYAITKYVNELYADVFSRTYGLECIGLRYFNVFGRKQSPNGAYAAVIPLFVKKLIKLESPVINGDGEYSRDFTYIDNVIQMNMLAMKTDNPDALNTVYNTAFGEQTSLNQLISYIKEFLAIYNPEIVNVKIEYGPNRLGDIPHSLASIDKAMHLLNYKPKFSVRDGLEKAIEWYWQNLK